ncbi:unnamed protein product [Merluccius merluccius]
MEMLRLPAISGATQMRRAPPVTQGVRDMKAQNYLKPRPPKHAKPVMKILKTQGAVSRNMEKLGLPAITGATQVRRAPPVTQGVRDMKAQNYLEPRSPKHTKPAPVTQGVQGMKAPNLRRTLYSVNGDAYTGEWLEKQKHGKRLRIAK